MESKSHVKINCRIIVLEYNSPDLLRKCLPSIVAAIEKSCHSITFTVLDNGSDPQSQVAVREVAPLADYVKSSENRILCSYNDYAQKINEPYLLFLNNDVLVDEDFIDPLIQILDRDDKAFFAASMIKDMQTGVPNGGIAKLRYKWGLPWCSGDFEGRDKMLLEPSISLQTGFGLFRRDAFLKLGGFDDLYLPGTVEDLDICYRAYRQGYQGYYCPNSLVFHIGQASFKKAFGQSGIRIINRRNMYLFVWKNIRNPFMLLQHVICIPLQLAKYILLGQVDFLKGFWLALKRLPYALRRRQATAGEYTIVSDTAIFSLIYGKNSLEKPMAPKL